MLSFNFGRGQASELMVDQMALENWAGVFVRASQANVTYFDSLVLDQVAQEAGVRTEVLQAGFAANNFDYLVARLYALPAAQELLERYIASGAKARAYAQLGFALASYLASSSLVAQYYSLDAQTDENGNVVSIGRDRALTAMLDSAAIRTRERVAPVDDVGGDSSLATLFFQTGQSQRELGEPNEKLNALRSYWTASTYARLQTLMVQGEQ